MTRDIPIPARDREEAENTNGLVVQMPSLASKLAEVMGAVGAVKKGGYNDFHNYHYATEADLLEEVRSKLADRGVFLLPSLRNIGEREVVSEKGKHSTVTTVTVDFQFIDGLTGESVTATWAGQGDDPADKGVYKAYTGALKYFLMKTFLIPTEDDPERDTRTDERSSGGQKRTVGEGKASDKQLQLVTRLCKEVPGAGGIVSEITGEAVIKAEWSKKTASQVIEALMEAAKKPKPDIPMDDPSVPSTEDPQTKAAFEATELGE